MEVFASANARDPEHPELHDNFSAILRWSRGSYAMVSQTLSAFEHHQTVKVSGTDGARGTATIRRLLQTDANKSRCKKAEMFGMFLTTMGGGTGLVLFGFVATRLGRRGAFLF